MYGYMANPASLLQWSIPLFNRGGINCRLHFWFLLSAVFAAIYIVQANLPIYFIATDLALMLGVLLAHEYGHRFFAQRVGGNHWEWVLWPLGGMVPPTAPPTPKATLVANIGGIAFTLPFVILGLAGLLFIPGIQGFAFGVELNPFRPVVFKASAPFGSTIGFDLLVHSLITVSWFSIAICSINLFPAYWFDGGRIWEASLWRWLGRYRAMMSTAVAGMALSAPFFLLSLLGLNFLGMVIWALIFADSFKRRQELKAAGPGVIEDEGESYDYMGQNDEPRAKRRKPSWFKNAAKKAAQERAEQEKIDAILAKVHDHGLHSLTWREKRALKKATEKQRQRDLAERS